MTLSMGSYHFVAVFVLALTALVTTFGEAPAGSTPLVLINRASEPIELFWVDSTASRGSPDALISMGPPVDVEDSTGLDSYDGHQFMVRFKPHKPNVEAKFRKGRAAEEFIVTYDETRKKLAVKLQPTERQMKKIPPKEVKVATKQLPRHINSSANLMDTISEATSYCSKFRGEEFSTCMASNIVDDITALTETKTQLSKFRDAMSFRLRNYTCADPTMRTSDPIFSYDLSLADKDVKVEVLLNKTHSKIWKVENFITDAECDVLQTHGKPLLRRATVAAEDGSSMISENRKAQQAAYNLHKKNPESDPLWPLFQRVLEITNHHTGMSLEPPGQEDFTIIQYNADDQYTPHCDGSCDNSPHVSTGRVATAVLYCQAPIRGGATTFTKSDILVVPKRGAATFFSYKGPDGRMDDGYTEHSGCPVMEGEKWITTVWMREGVSHDKPWHRFDPSGIPMMEDY